ncbi:hypothetical protein LDE01_16220 [Lactobacillus delbrueckii subsp. delbrueckii]|nr:hypothetical protein LDE01_16220 [Lactobacillus delbrueckii subsp. delbrueckii]
MKLRFPKQKNNSGTKERCDKASQKLDALYELKKHREQEELLKAIDKSTRTKAEILAFLESHA